MPGPHLDLMVMQCFQDVGGVDIWRGSFWEQNSQWWIGWHMPNGSTGLAALDAFWQDPNGAEWQLIGHEKWLYTRRGGAKLVEAYYNNPNPSTGQPWEGAIGHHHLALGRNGRWINKWVPTPIGDHPIYLKGGVTSPKGKGDGNGKNTAPKGGKAKGKWQPKGKGQGKDQGKGTGKNTGKGKGAMHG